MAGADVAATLVAQRPLLRVLLMSGYTDRDQATPIADDAIAYIQKPFDADAIVRKVRELLAAVVG
jgi:DNA-binding NtrC family response regulator